MLDDSSKVLGHSLGIRTMSETYSSHLQEARRNELKEDDGERQGGDDEERKPAEDQEETGKDKEDQEEPKVISKKRKKKPKASHSGTEDNTSVDTSSLQYYLYLPVLSTAQRRVFMHLNATTILDDALQGQGVEEFPTIRVSISGPDELKEQGYTISKFVKPAAEHSLDTAPIRPLSSEG